MAEDREDMSGNGGHSVGIPNKLFDAQADYYSHLRPELLKLCEGLPMSRVLEIGCGVGETLNYLKRNGAGYTVGVEIREDVAQIAAGKGNINSVLVGDIETLDLPYGAGHFDLIVASFVLEHVRDPWTVTSRLVSLLRPGGYLVGSLPNVRHWSVLAPLLFSGRWEYAEDGIMDWTHFRFFTRRTIQELLLSRGLIVEVNRGEVAGMKAGLANSATLGLFSDFLAFAYNFRAKKPS